MSECYPPSPPSPARGEGPVLSGIGLGRNTVVEAGAGTGKTTRLVQAILRALFERRLALDSIVALTFTKKAAGELRERIAQALQGVLQAPAMPETYRGLGLHLDDLQAQARAALAQVDRVNIGTIHSFAYSLLKRFPLISGIDPEAQVDENGIHYDERFQREWSRWLSVELQSDSPGKSDWLEILSVVRLSDIEVLARRLCDFAAPLDALPIDDAGLSKELVPFQEELRKITARNPRSNNAAEIASACEEIFGWAVDGAWDPLRERIPMLLPVLEKSLGPCPKSWSEEDFATLKDLQKVAGNLLRRGDRLLFLLTRRLKPFIARFRQAILAEGYLSHSALLLLSCELVRRHPDLRRQLKKEFRMLFIDEFQDTDPLQGELLLFLAEKVEGQAASWREVELEAGKLYVVGDPKQSIYRFRGADIAAYRQITDHILRQGGEAHALQKNYRSHDRIVGLVNATFAGLIRPNALISPAYIPIEPDPDREPKTLPMQGIELRLAISEEPLSAQGAQEAEAEDLAAWILENVGRQDSYDAKERRRRPLQYRDVALIFRTISPMRFYVEALRRRGIPFVVEGERYFFSTPEVTDFINLLRVIENPRDSLALVGFLRSSMGGFTDAEILALKEAGGLEATRALPAKKLGNHVQHAHYLKTWKLLQDLNGMTGRVPLAEILDRLFESTFILELAARSYHQDQAVANLLKLRRLLEEFASEGLTTVRSLLAKVKDFMDEDRLEGENPLADESYDAVRLLTIHKAKGLEFPVVILPSLNSGRRVGTTDAVQFDWSTRRLGLRLGSGLQNFDKFRLDWETRDREREEEHRVLYVAMTRARERLILAGGRVQSPRPSYLQTLLSVWGLEAADLKPGTHRVNGASLDVVLVPKTEITKSRRALAPTRPAPVKLSPKTFADLWGERERQCVKIQETPVVLHPTALVEKGDVRPRRVPTDDDLDNDEKPVLPGRAAMLGTLVHRFLELWDFGCEKCSMPAQLKQIADYYFASLGVEGDFEAILQEAQRLLADFIGSEAYQEIKTAAILGREVPFFYPLTGGTLMRGRLDILYRLPSAGLVIGDYKTDAISKQDSLERKALEYAPQADAYREALQRAVGERPLFKVIYLRAGRAVTR